MLPASISHSGENYDLGHLQQQFRDFSWVAADGTTLSFSVRVRYSDHCISETVQLPVAVGCHVFGLGLNTRIFDIDRYQWSLELPEIVESLFDKPTTAIQLTPEHNGYVFRLTMKHPLPSGQKYYCFVRLKQSGDQSSPGSPQRLDLFVESAYAREVPPIRAKERVMFGKLAERLAG